MGDTGGKVRGREGGRRVLWTSFSVGILQNNRSCKLLLSVVTCGFSMLKLRVCA